MEIGRKFRGRQVTIVNAISSRKNKKKRIAAKAKGQQRGGIKLTHPSVKALGLPPDWGYKRPGRKAVIAIDDKGREVLVKCQALNEIGSEPVMVRLLHDIPSSDLRRGTKVLAQWDGQSCLITIGKPPSAPIAVLTEVRSEKRTKRAG